MCKPNINLRRFVFTETFTQLPQSQKIKNRMCIIVPTRVEFQTNFHIMKSLISFNSSFYTWHNKVLKALTQFDRSLEHLSSLDTFLHHFCDNFSTPLHLISKLFSSSFLVVERIFFLAELFFAFCLNGGEETWKETFATHKPSLK